MKTVELKLQTIGLTNMIISKNFYKLIGVFELVETDHQLIYRELLALRDFVERNPKVRELFKSDDISVKLYDELDNIQMDNFLNLANWWLFGGSSNVIVKDEEKKVSEGIVDNTFKTMDLFKNCKKYFDNNPDSIV